MVRRRLLRTRQQTRLVDGRDRHAVLSVEKTCDGEIRDANVLMTHLRRIGICRGAGWGLQYSLFSLWYMVWYTWYRTIPYIRYILMSFVSAFCGPFLNSCSKFKIRAIQLYLLHFVL